MSVEQASSLKDGQTYRLGMYAATSSHKRTQTQIQAWHNETGAASAAASAPRVFWQFTIPKHCWQVTQIKSVSMHKDEHELLMVPYSAIIVRRIIVRR